MDIIKATYAALANAAKMQNVCAKCKKSEHDLVGISRNTRKNISIFSPENLCIDCEIRLFPERFHGCGFCKRPIREKFSCTICTDGFVSWVKDAIHPLDKITEMIKRSASDLVQITIRDLPTIENRGFILRVEDGYYRWPGFYAGITNRFSRDLQENKTKNEKQSETSTTPSRYENSYDLDTTVNDEHDVVIDRQYEDTHIVKTDQQCNQHMFPVWIVPKMLKQGAFSFTDLKLDTKIFRKLLLEILTSNGIKLYNDVQIDADSYPLEQIVKVNPYDTRTFSMKTTKK